MNICPEQLDLAIEKREKRKRLRKNPCPWVTGDIIALMNRRDHLHKKAKRTSSHIYWSEYKTLKKQIRVELKKAKTNHLESLINDDKSNQNSLWQLLKSIIKIKADKNISLTVDGEDLSEPSDVAECFNNYFVNSINDLVNEIDADEIFTLSSTSHDNLS